MKNIYILFFLTMSSISLISQNKYKLLMADAAINLTGNDGYEFKSIELNYTQSFKKGKYHWFAEILEYKTKTISSFNVSRTQHQYVAGLGMGKYISTKLLDIITFRYDGSLGYRYEYLAQVPSAIYDYERLLKVHGLYFRPAITFAVPIKYNLGVYTKLSCDFTANYVKHHSYNPSLSSHQRDLITPDINLNFYIHMGFQYQFN